MSVYLHAGFPLEGKEGEPTLCLHGKGETNTLPSWVGGGGGGGGGATLCLHGWGGGGGTNTLPSWEGGGGDQVLWSIQEIFSGLIFWESHAEGTVTHALCTPGVQFVTCKYYCHLLEPRREPSSVPGFQATSAPAASLHLLMHTCNVLISTNLQLKQQLAIPLNRIFTLPMLIYQLEVCIEES